jgi:hypothetical protein
MYLINNYPLGDESTKAIIIKIKIKETMSPELFPRLAIGLGLNFFTGNLFIIVCVLVGVKQIF